MKKKYFLLSLVFLLGLSACGSSQADAQVSSDLPVAVELVAGTLNLEETEQAVSGEQASQLLVMWQVYQSLTGSSTAAQAEIDGLLEQIQETMTADQMEAISAMQLTQQDVFTLLQEHGGSMGQARQSSTGTSSSNQSGGGFAPPDGGGMPGGAPPDGGGAPMDVGMAGAGPGASTDQSQETVAGLGAGGSAGVPVPLVEALIQVLQQKAGS